MKKILALTLALMLALIVPAMAEEASYNIGICQLVQHVALDDATQGFMDALTEKLGDKVSFDLQNASGDSATCITIVNSLISENVDLILANATPALQAAQAGTGDIPIGHQRYRLCFRPGYRRLDRRDRHEYFRHQRSGSPGWPGTVGEGSLPRSKRSGPAVLHRRSQFCVPGGNH